ncbi:MAG: hypothetical protein ABL958_10955 [Bdellovibrionia bacterium]
MKSLTPLLILLLVTACESTGGVDSIYGSFVGATILDGTWIQQRLVCDGTEVASNPGESTAMTLAGRSVVISNTFPNGNQVCNLRTSGSLTYEPTTMSTDSKKVTIMFGNTACSSECDPAMCVLVTGRMVPPATLIYELNEPNLKLSTNEGTALGCANAQSTDVEFTRQN